jgi:putative ABC transport system permease protein
VRAALALASVAGGVAAVIVTGELGAGAKEEVLRATENMGSNVLVVSPAQVGISAARKSIRGVVTSLTPDDYRAIAQLPEVADAVPGFEGSATVKADGNAMSATVLGTTSAYLGVCRFRLRQGRFLSDDDDIQSVRVAVLGSRVAATLFGEQNAVGRQIRIRDIPFEVIGVLDAKGVLADGSEEDDRVIIPNRTALRRVFNTTWLNPIFVSVRKVTETDGARAEIAGLLRSRHRLDQTGVPDDFTIQDKTKVLEARSKIASSLTILATGLAASSLVVGGVGILALMLMSVKERTTEIGLRIAVGARSKDILVQFLLEAIFIAIGGWLAGAALGMITAAGISAATAWKTAISPPLVFTTLGIMAASGIIFGAYPARKAALLPPITALRME